MFRQNLGPNRPILSQRAPGRIAGSQGKQLVNSGLMERRCLRLRPILETLHAMLDFQPRQPPLFYGALLALSLATCAVQIATVASGWVGSARAPRASIAFVGEPRPVGGMQLGCLLFGVLDFDLMVVVRCDRGCLHSLGCSEGGDSLRS